MTIPRISSRTWAVVVLVLFAAAGAAVLDDYGVPSDTHKQRQIAAANLEYVLGNDNALSAGGHYRLVASDRYYGVAFELPLLLAERALGLGDSRTAYLFRHYATHLFWLCGAFACFLLARRLFGSGPVALAAMLLFLLQPRLYAHSFFNSKDVPFLSMFMIALYLTHRAFEKDTVRAFVVLGAAVGVLTNLRIMGVMLFAAVLGMRACDLLCAAQRSERRRVLKTAGAFTAACVATLYAISPYLWSDPREFAEALRVLSEHPHNPGELYRGRLISSSALPWQYVPTWMAITTPPFTLLLACVGIVGVLRRGATRPGRAVRNTPLRFECLTAACLTAPPIAVAALGAHTYDGWRHLYFLHAPLALLAASGLRLLASRDMAWARRGTYWAAGIAVVGVLIAMARIHPLQNVYFNFLVARTTPEHLRMRYEMDYWEMAHIGALRHLARIHPSTSLCLAGVAVGSPRLLSESQQFRLTDPHRQTCRGRSDFFFGNEMFYGIDPPETYAPEIWTRKVYGSTIARVYSLDPALLDDFHEDLLLTRFRETHRSLTEGAPAVRARYDVYFDAARSALTYARAPCVPAVGPRVRFFLHVVPANADDLPGDRVRDGYDNLDFYLPGQALFDGKCLATVRLPEYAVDHVRTGQTEWRDDAWTPLWEETIRIE